MKNRETNRLSSMHVDLIASPLPLIELPPDNQIARCGWIGRPDKLPNRRHENYSHDIDQEPEQMLNVKSNNDEKDIKRTSDESEIERILIYDYPKQISNNEDIDTNSLKFDSVFESGNLLRAERIINKDEIKRDNSHQFYELLIHPDLNNHAYRQWFYFEIKNGKVGQAYHLSIINLAKTSSLFQSGQQPVIYSNIDAKVKQIGWRHGCTNIKYAQSQSQSNLAGKSTLSFTYEFQNENDTVYIACLVPYTYSDLMEYFKKLSENPKRAFHFRRTELCQTLAGNSCDIIRITSSQKDGIPLEDRPIIVISSRVHPGESNSSWMMKGILDFMTDDDNEEAQILRENFVFKIVPMLNPDGVINGNTRVNLAGWDLNRKWSYPVEKLFPTIFHLKRIITNEKEKIAMFCDLHGHSINKNIFMYGCHKAIRKNGNKISQKDSRIFPMILSKNSDLFDFSSCNFAIQKSKSDTARIVAYELGIVNSYTLEASFCGPDFGPRKNTQYSTFDFENMGRQWCSSLIIYYKLKRSVNELKKKKIKLSRKSDKNDDIPIKYPDSNSNSSIESSLKQKPVDIDDDDNKIFHECEIAISALSKNNFENEKNRVEQSAGYRSQSECSECDPADNSLQLVEENKCLEMEMATQNQNDSIMFKSLSIDNRCGASTPSPSIKSIPRMIQKLLPKPKLKSGCVIHTENLEVDSSMKWIVSKNGTGQSDTSQRKSKKKIRKSLILKSKKQRIKPSRIEARDISDQNKVSTIIENGPSVRRNEMSGKKSKVSSPLSIKNSFPLFNEDPIDRSNEKIESRLKNISIN